METEKEMNGTAARESCAEHAVSTHYLEYVLDNSADAIGIMDRHGRTIRWNKAATALFGYSLSELKEKRVFDLYPEKDQLDKMLTDLRQKGYVRKYEINIQRKDGEVVPFEMSISLLKNKKGEVVGSVGIARDLSDIKMVLAELKTLNRQLREEVKRSNQMEAELREARDLLEQKLEERSSKLTKASEILQKSMKRIKDITDADQ
jgi:PAS domain S-box-containing protein